MRVQPRHNQVCLRTATSKQEAEDWLGTTGQDGPCVVYARATKATLLQHSRQHKSCMQGEEAHQMECSQCTPTTEYKRSPAERVSDLLEQLQAL